MDTTWSTGRPNRKWKCLARLSITFFAAAASSLDCSSDESSGAAFAVRGSYISRTFGASTNVLRSSKTGSFEMSVKGCQWFLRLEPSGADKLGPVEVGTGEEGDVRMLIRCKLSEELLARSPDINREIGVLEPFPNALGRTQPVAVTLWWAYASHCYLGTNGLDRVRPLFLPEAEENFLYYTGHTVAAKIERSPQAPFAPLRTAFLDDGLHRFWEKPQFAEVGLPFQTQKRRKPFDRGFTNVLFTVSAVQVVGGYHVPQECTLDEYKPLPSKLLNGSAGLAHTRRIEIMATDCSPQPFATSFSPAIGGRITFDDHRFAEGDPPLRNIDFMPGTYDQKWLSKEQVKTSPEYREAVRQQSLLNRIVANDLSKRGRARFWKYAIWIGLVAPSSILFFHCYGRDRQKHPS